MGRASRLAGLVAVLALASCNDHATAPIAAPAASTVAPQASAVAVADQAVVPSGQADRVAPPEVPPVVRDGVAYAQAEDGMKAGAAQSRGVLVASDAASGKPLWAVAVYPASVDPKQESDAQWIFFKSMAFDPDGRLRIVNEAGKAFLVDVHSHAVSPAL